ncbi:PAS domain S-box protein [Pseudomonas sp. CCM 7891]|uniref:histidine kinase n=1 Tax=Pseudomonas karstica TaxID=1055468 RepID=A0A7X2RTG1_9PSED|nr:PAS domain-containing sensor histidine kinase [Pseudomonas karstica]MTD20777.1 PAS domain S-box protein [Pseudomonas karstica]
MNNQLNRVIEALPAIAWMATAEGGIDFFNQRWYDYTGLELEHDQRRGLEAAVHTEDLSRLVQSRQTTAPSELVHELEIRLKRFDGVYRWFLLTLCTLPATTDLAWIRCGICTDIDDRKRAEAALAECRQHHLSYIARTDFERTQSEDTLNKMRSELAHMTRVASLDTLTASIAHEVNQPLSGIITNASTCLRMLVADPPNINGALETARRTIRDGNRAANVISRLRTLFSKNVVNVEAVDLNESTREVLALTCSELQRNDITTHLDLADNLPRVPSDRVQLQQVILNLLLNACEAMIDIDDRPRLLLIRTGHDTHHVRLEVRDAGCGVEPGDLEKIFDAFYTTKQVGMGMGLSISRSIIESYNGQLSATRNDGHGATFWFALPRQSSCEPTPASPPHLTMTFQ